MSSGNMEKPAMAQGDQQQWFDEVEKEVDLKGVVCRQGQGQATSKEHWKGVLVVVQEEGVVAEGAHAQPNLRQVEQVLQRQRLAQIDAMRYVLAQQEGVHQMIHIPSLACKHHTALVKEAGGKIACGCSQ